MKARPRCTCEANATERTYGPFLGRPTHNRKGRRATGPVAYRNIVLAGVSGISLFVIDKSCPLLRRRRGGKLLEARIIPERIEHRIEPEERGGERHAKPESA
jgi:hypothetical protein